MVFKLYRTVVRNCRTAGGNGLTILRISDSQRVGFLIGPCLVKQENYFRWSDREESSLLVQDKPKLLSYPLSR